MKIKICEYLFHGGRTIEHEISDVVSICSLEYMEPSENSTFKFIGYDYPTTKKHGSFIVHLKGGIDEVYPASNWQIEF